MKALEDMDIHELRIRKDELIAELSAAMNRIQEFDRREAGLPLKADEPEKLPGPNAHPEGADVPEEDDAA